MVSHGKTNLIVFQYLILNSLPVVVYFQHARAMVKFWRQNSIYNVLYLDDGLDIVKEY